MALSNGMSMLFNKRYMLLYSFLTIMFIINVNCPVYRHELNKRTKDRTKEQRKEQRTEQSKNKDSTKNNTKYLTL